MLPIRCAQRSVAKGIVMAGKDDLPGGMKVGDEVFFCGSKEIWNDTALYFGTGGDVVGPSKLYHETGVMVRFPGIYVEVDLELTKLSRQRPAKGSKPPLKSGPTQEQAVAPQQQAIDRSSVKLIVAESPKSPNDSRTFAGLWVPSGYSAFPNGSNGIGLLMTGATCVHPTSIDGKKFTHCGCIGGVGCFCFAAGSAPDDMFPCFIPFPLVVPIGQEYEWRENEGWKVDKPKSCIEKLDCVGARLMRINQFLCFLRQQLRK